MAIAFAVCATQAGAATSVFTYTGGEQTYVVPADVPILHVTARGADGGSGSPWLDNGVGTLIFADVPVRPGETLYVEVGGQGSPGDDCCSAAFNGGGAGGADTIGTNNGGGGGGASDVRRLPRTAPGTEASRLVVAGGGGGGGGGGVYGDVPWGGVMGGPGRGCTDCGAAGGAGSASAAGSGGGPDGVGASGGADGGLGSGGTGGDGSAGGAGGGGGGLYGGGGGGGGDIAGGGGGGAGSSLAVYRYRLGASSSVTAAPFGVAAVTITPEVGTPVANVTPGTVAFGRHPLGTTSERVVTINNTGSATLRFVGAKVLSSRYPDFAFAGCAAPIPVGASCQLTVRFTPHRTGTQRAHAQIDTNGRPRFAMVTLTGTGFHARRKLSALRISPSTFAPARRGSSTARTGPVVVSYRADSAGTTTFRVLRVKRGHLVPIGASFAHADRRGSNRIRFTGRVRRGGKLRPLMPGIYRLRASVRSDVATGRSVSAAFRIARS